MGKKYYYIIKIIRWNLLIEYFTYYQEICPSMMNLDKVQLVQSDSAIKFLFFDVDWDTYEENEATGADDVGRSGIVPIKIGYSLTILDT